MLNRPRFNILQQHPKQILIKLWRFINPKRNDHVLVRCDENKKSLNK